MKSIIVIFLFILCGLARSQSPKPSFYEVRWAFFHPMAAIKVKRITAVCNKMAEPKMIQHELDSFWNGGKADAFRHVYYMAAYRQKISENKLRRLGRAHEKHNYRQFLRKSTEYGEKPDSLSSIMDLKNNELGFEIGCRHKTADAVALRKLVFDRIKDGDAAIMKRNENGKYLDCEGHEIDLERYNNTWGLPKCLVPSNYSVKD